MMQSCLMFGLYLSLRRIWNQVNGQSNELKPSAAREDKMLNNIWCLVFWALVVLVGCEEHSASAPISQACRAAFAADKIGGDIEMLREVSSGVTRCGFLENPYAKAWIEADNGERCPLYNVFARIPRKGIIEEGRYEVLPVLEETGGVAKILLPQRRERAWIVVNVESKDLTQDPLETPTGEGHVRFGKEDLILRSAVEEVCPSFQLARSKDDNLELE